MVANQRGFSLIEILVALSVTLIGIFAITTAFSDISKDFNKVFLNRSIKTEANLLMGFLQRNMLRSDIHFYGFTAQTSGLPLGRIVIPYEGRCANLTEPCENSTSYLWVYSDVKSPSLPVICPLDEKTLLIDASVDDFGNLNVSGNSVEVGANGTQMPTGEIDLSQNTVIALTDEPNSVLFSVSGSLQKFDPQYNAETGTFAEPRYAGNSDCIKYTKNRNQLYTLPIKPFLIPDSGVSAPDSQTVLNAMGRPPVKLSPLRLMSVGMGLVDGEMNMVVNDCALDSTSKISCTKVFLRTEGVVSLRAQQIFNKPFAGEKVIRASAFSKNYCDGSGCEVLPIPSPLPVSLNGEIDGQIIKTSFSLIKQEFIHTISFYLQVNRDYKTKKTNPELFNEAYHVSSF
ncbi:PilW family protein [Bdellovibrio bacteriovorus]|uniref:PilW family protein n=1 Tax=Bdellovibrio bacteriovorus TaxID=959 RepID=UPI0035A5D37B